MTNRMEETSPNVKARIAGAFYLFNIVTILSAVFIFSRLRVAGDPAATATNVLAHAHLFRLSFAFELISTACSVVVAALFYELFKPVSRSISLLAAFFRLLACAIAAVGYSFQLAPLQVLGGAHYLSVLRPEELQGLAGLLSTFSAQTANIAIVFFGFHFVLLGYLILGSTFLPRILGVFAGLAGVGALAFLVPPLATYLFPYWVVAGLLGEATLTLWLVLMGVNVQRWKAQASAAAGSHS